MITIPTIKEIVDSVIARLENAFSTTIPTFGKNFLRAWANAWGGTLALFYRAIGKLQKNIFADTADPESSGGTLERFGRVKLGRNPFPAQGGQYVITVTGQALAVIPSNTIFKSNDDSVNPGKLYILDAQHIMVGSTDSITVRALELGLDSRMAIGNMMTATAPIPNVDSVGTVTSESVTPMAPESIEDYRRKTLDAYRLEPNGGAASDYRLWAADAQGVYKVYPYARSGDANEINLYVQATVADSTDGIGTPSAGLLTDVEAVVELDPDTTKPINQRGRRPLGIFLVHYLPITVRLVDIEIPNFQGLTGAIETEINAALELYINNVNPFIAGADVLAEKNDIVDVNRIISTILLARPGSTFDLPILKIDTVPVSTFTCLNGDITHVNSISYT